MLRRSAWWFLLNVSTESPSFRHKPGLGHPLLEVQQSPYKEQFKDFWATPVPWQDREYGEKPKLGDPIPTRRASTVVVVARNRHADYDRVQRGEDNDYKVLVHFREGKGQFARDQYTIPSAPLNMEDRNMESWEPVLARRGLTTQYPDLQERLCAMRALLIMANVLLIPRAGGGIAEVEGPPGPKKWATIVSQCPRYMRNLVDVLELPMEQVLDQLLPFRNIVTPTTETFRYLNSHYVVLFDKIPCVEFTQSNVGEQLYWASPQEALARFNAGIMNMPTPTAILLSELTNQFPTFADVSGGLTNHSAPVTILPELMHHGQEKVATVTLPGDMHHSATTPEDRERKYVRRFVYEKDYPWGVRAVFEERPATMEEVDLKVTVAAPLLLEEANENDQLYADVPYLKRRVAGSDTGRTAYAMPDMKLRDGPENEDGIIPNRQRYTNLELDGSGSDSVKNSPGDDDDAADWSRTVPSIMRRTPGAK